MTDRGRHAMEEAPEESAAPQAIQAPDVAEAPAAPAVAAGASLPRRKLLWAGGAAAAALTLGALGWANWPAQGVDVVTVLGAEYTTNMQVDEHGGYVYVTVPVNSDAGKVVLEVGDAGDNKEIREFLDTLDTLVPGEHVVELGESNLHFIVDGLAE